MHLLSLDLQRPSSPEADPPAQATTNSGGRDATQGGIAFLATSSTLAEASPAVLPVRGLLYSFLFHEIALLALLLCPGIRSVTRDSAPAKQWQLTMIPKDVLYLPQLGGGTEGGSSRHAPAETKSADSAPASSPSREGLAYPGLQPIVSDPPQPTNRIQTILQRAEADLVVLKQFVPLPNMVKLPEAPPPALAAEATSTAKPVLPAPVVPHEEPVLLPLDAPKLVLPLQAVPASAEPSPQSTPAQPEATDETARSEEHTS